MIVERKGGVRWLVAFMVLVLFLFSCTYDYFEDENNFRLYIPQVKEGSIQNLYVSFHDVNGKHSVTREIQYPFDKDEPMRQGILRFKLYPGQYNVSCFADYTPGSITLGNDFENSSKDKDVIDLDNNLFKSRNSDPRALFTTVSAFPIGHPAAKDSVLVNMSEKQRFKGKARFVINNLPDIISQIDILYKGLATRYFFNGTFGSFSSDDQVLLSIQVADYKVGNSIDFTDIINPSVGTSFGTVPNPLLSKGPLASVTPMSFTMLFYDKQKNLIGATVFDSETLSLLANNKKPLDENGNPVTDLVLRPQSMVRFTIEDFMIIFIELIGWGDTNQGEITPL